MTLKEAECGCDRVMSKSHHILRCLATDCTKMDVDFDSYLGQGGDNGCFAWFNSTMTKVIVGDGTLY